MTDSTTNLQTQLKYFFERNGYLRLPDLVRQEQEGHSTYKKGYELRLVAFNETELGEIRDLLGQAGFRLAKPHIKVNRIIQPVYGKQAVERFCELIRKPLEAEPAEE